MIHVKLWWLNYRFRAKKDIFKAYFIFAPSLFVNRWVNLFRIQKID
jgi:hypothetical protein